MSSLPIDHLSVSAVVFPEQELQLLNSSQDLPFRTHPKLLTGHWPPQLPVRVSRAGWAGTREDMFPNQKKRTNYRLGRKQEVILSAEILTCPYMRQAQAQEQARGTPWTGHSSWHFGKEKLLRGRSTVRRFPGPF